jgi:NAD(P)-dependent dehydrogenase (short-subunit alcohol dehydrogenase family)
VLVNNAGIAIRPESDDLADVRESYAKTFDANITSVFLVTTTFLPLLRESPAPKVINISSGRGSFTLSQSPDFPPTAVISYSVSKAALNMLTLEMQKAERKREKKEREREVAFWATNPAHCKTAFNGFRGTKDPLVGAEAVVRLIEGGEARWRKGVFWEWEGEEMRVVPW